MEKQDRERASAPIAQVRVRRSSKKKRRDVQRRTRGSASLPAPAEQPVESNKWQSGCHRKSSEVRARPGPGLGLTRPSEPANCKRRVSHRGLGGHGGELVSCPRNTRYFAGGQLAVFQGASEAPISESYGSSEQRGKTANWPRPRGLR